MGPRRIRGENVPENEIAKGGGGGETLIESRGVITVMKEIQIEMSWSIKKG